MPELFQHRCCHFLKELDGVVFQMDDILVHGWTQQQYHQRLCKVLLRLQRAGLTLNSSKCKFSVSELLFLKVRASWCYDMDCPSKESLLRTLCHVDSVYCC